MTVADIITIIIAAAGLVSAVSLIYSKLIAPAKSVVDKVAANDKEIALLREEIAGIKSRRADDVEYSREVWAVVMESLVAVLDGLEQSGANGMVSKTKHKLIEFLSRQLDGKSK